MLSSSLYMYVVHELCMHLPEPGPHLTSLSGFKSFLDARVCPYYTYHSTTLQYAVSTCSIFTHPRHKRAQSPLPEYVIFNSKVS